LIFAKFGSVTPVDCCGPPPKPKGGSIIPWPLRKFADDKIEFPA